MASAEYLAGLFDGEGCISIHFGPRKRSGIGRYLHCAISLAMLDRRGPAAFADRYGGRVTHEKNEVYKWTCPKADHRNFLLDVRPYLLVKGEQADLALQFRATRLAKGSYRLTDEAVALREELHQRMKRLNAKREPILT